mmetsp:Transcript_22702/g.43397  ORF Transcript_22702/g.43397 Transcript_22702/m.43397 type:complete len:214 (+) Transcript_22702:88-729(+)
MEDCRSIHMSLTSRIGGFPPASVAQRMPHRTRLKIPTPEQDPTTSKEEVRRQNNFLLKNCNAGPENSMETYLPSEDVLLGSQIGRTYDIVVSDPVQKFTLVYDLQFSLQDLSSLTQRINSPCLFPTGVFDNFISVDLVQLAQTSLQHFLHGHNRLLVTLRCPGTTNFALKLFQLVLQFVDIPPHQTNLGEHGTGSCFPGHFLRLPLFQRFTLG